MTAKQPVCMMSGIETSGGLASNHMCRARSADPKLVANATRIVWRNNPCGEFHGIQIEFDRSPFGRLPYGVLAVARQSLPRHLPLGQVTPRCRDRVRPLALSGSADRQIRPQHRHTFLRGLLLPTAGDCLKPSQAGLVPHFASDTA